MTLPHIFDDEMRYIFTTYLLKLELAGVLTIMNHLAALLSQRRGFSLARTGMETRKGFRGDNSSRLGRLWLTGD